MSPQQASFSMGDNVNVVGTASLLVESGTYEGYPPAEVGSDDPQVKCAKTGRIFGVPLDQLRPAE